MEANEKDILLIEDYLDGKLDKEQTESFNARLKTDRDFALLFETRSKLAAEYQRASQYQSLKDEIGRVMEQEKSTHFLGIRPVWFYSVAASVILLVGLYIVFLTFSDGSGTSELPMAAEDSTEVLRMDKPENYAAVDTLTAVLVSPLQGEVFTSTSEIRLQWEDVTGREAELMIQNEQDKLVLIRKRILLSEGVFAIQPGMLPKGKYNWYIDDTLQKGSFEIK
jgi:hypothetical protein